MTTQEAAKTEQCGPMQTTDAHMRFEPFVGTFKASVTMYMQGEKHTSTGTMVNELDLGGRFLKQTYKGDPGPGPFPNFEGRGFWGYNTVAGEYEGLWIDSACTFMQTETGQVDADGKVWNMLGEMTNPQTGQPMTKRSVITLKDRDHHSMQMYMAMGDGAEMKMMEIEYTRVM